MLVLRRYVTQRLLSHFSVTENLSSGSSARRLWMSFLHSSSKQTASFRHPCTRPPQISNRDRTTFLDVHLQTSLAKYSSFCATCSSKIEFGIRQHNRRCYHDPPICGEIVRQRDIAVVREEEERLLVKNTVLSKGAAHSHLVESCSGSRHHEYCKLPNLHELDTSVCRKLILMLNRLAPFTTAGHSSLLVVPDHITLPSEA